ncbi:ABC transporter permease [Streptomonospora litoralis]|uniref:ABC-2 family transporter protein n=1 Tax=Streptomonospora litoralis TaxID=2498135 RepID=A0A4P6Q7B0_9ACTN|nr:ABC transporter permease [Streptomonospora litoralis]QBI56678.1 ABC-2 family transporter protein [Streptomonospora litoralis]
MSTEDIRRSGSGPEAETETPDASGAQPGSGQAVWLVARREMVTRVRSKAFLFGTLGMVVAILLIAAVPMVAGLLFGGDGGARVAAAPQVRPILQQAVEGSADSPGSPIEAAQWQGRAQAEEAVRAGELDAALVSGEDGPVMLVDGTPDPALARALDEAYARHSTAEALQGSGADTSTVQQAMSASVGVDTLGGAGDTQAFLARMVVGYALTFLLYLSILTFGVYVAQGVVEEKASRVVELMLAAVRPWQLLFGKVLGIGALGLAQVGVVLVAGVGVAALTDYLSDLPVSFTLLAISLVAWFVLGYLFFATMLAASASLVSRQEDVQSAIQPVILIIAVPLVVTMMTITGGGGVAVDVLAVLPPFSPFMMPMRLAMGEAALWQNVLALAILAAALAGMVWLAARIYSGAVLGTGGKIKAKDAFRAGSR